VLQEEYEIMHAQEMRHWWFRGRRLVLMDLVRRATSGGGRPRILDYGCGTGGNSDELARMGEVVGVEPNAAAVALANARGAAQFCRGSGVALPLAAGSFDVVVASDVLEHIERDIDAVREIGRVLRPGGALVFSVPAHPWLFGAHDTALWHYRRYTRSGVRRLLAEAGLREEWLSYWNAALFVPVCAYRLLATRIHGDAPRSNVDVTPSALNEPLAAVLAVEAAILRHVRLPWGLSLLGIARRP